MHLKKVVVFQKEKQGFKFLGLQLRGFPKKVGEEALTAIPVVSIGSFYISTSSNTTLSKSLYFSFVFFRVFLATADRAEQREQSSSMCSACCRRRPKIAGFCVEGSVNDYNGGLSIFACGRGRNEEGRSQGGKEGHQSGAQRKWKARVR